MVFNVAQRAIPIAESFCYFWKPRQSRAAQFCLHAVEKNNVVITTNVKNFVEPTVLETKGEKCAVYQLPFLAPYSLEQERNQEKLYEIAIGQILENHEKRYADCASVLCAHLYVANSQTTKDSERSVIGTAEQVRQNLFSPFDYVALGHIHSVQKCGRAGNVWYSGSPLGYSFDDTNEKYMLDVQVSQGDVSVAKIPYKPLHKVTRLEVPYSDLCGGHINKALIERHKDDYVQIICTDDIPPVSPMPNIQMVLPNALSFMMKKRDGASGREAEFEKLLNTREADKPEKMIELFLSEANADKEIAPKQKALFMEIAGELQCREQN